MSDEAVAGNRGGPAEGDETRETSPGLVDSKRALRIVGCGVVFKASRGSWAVSWDDDRTQEFALGASLTKTRT